MPVSFARWEGAALLQEAAVALSKGAIGLHTGLAYQDRPSQRGHVLHLAWHYQLENDQEPSEASPWYLVLPDLDELEVVRLASFCQLVADIKPEIPYALRFAASGFDKEGRFLPGKGEIGLTCATFVLAIFEAARVELLDRDSWSQASPKRKEDDARSQRRLVEYLRNDASATKEHADAVDREVGCARFRSEEVAAASGLPERPAIFAKVEPEGVGLRQQVEAALAAHAAKTARARRKPRKK